LIFEEGYRSVNAVWRGALELRRPWEPALKAGARALPRCRQAPIVCRHQARA